MTLPFTTLSLSSGMQKNLLSLSYKTMTPVQAATLGPLLEGEDLTVQAETGSGKTAAFGIALVHRLKLGCAGPQGLVLCPTRELAEQVAGELRRLARHLSNIKVLTLCGGAYVKPQRASLAHGAHLIVGTPGRVEQHLREGTLDLNGLSSLVLDEADRMLDAGFSESLGAILAKVPQKRQTLLFSATFPESVVSLKDAAGLCGEVLRVETLTNEITQRFFAVSEGGKAEVIASLMERFRPDSVLCFCNTKLRCRALAEALCDHGFSALALHGGMDQKERHEVLARFENGSTPILVATDVAARGLDISGLAWVINADFAFDPEVHVHRIGRTGRAGEKGAAFTLMEPGEGFRLDAVNKLMGADFKTELFCFEEAAFKPSGPSKVVTLSINGGRKSKLRPGDILGALTKVAGLEGSEVGRIHCFDTYSYVGVAKDRAEEAVRVLSGKRIKGRRFIVRIHT
ncbi:MAG: ATP-dependent RNA helicase DbpA [Desulfobacterales bacterium]|nr:ATP-dependent RNA helicase DbpA [Desulfobacterales bacterium]